MQYNLVAIVTLLAVAYVMYKGASYFRNTKKVFIKVDESILREIYRDNNCQFPFEEFKTIWIAISQNLECAEGKMIENCKMGFLMKNYPFPEMFMDDIFINYEKYSNFIVSKEMNFYDFVVSLLAQKSS